MAETIEAAADAEMALAPAVNQRLESSEQSPEQQLQQPEHGQDVRQNETPLPLPPAFPKKRRGRPPGRPNMTVRETDYDDNPLVQAWNAAKGERAVPVVSIGIRAALTEQSLVHETQRAIFRLPSRETIHFVQGWITARHIASQRPSYVNGLLIHSRGHDAPVSCLQCIERRDKHALGPFLTCRVLPGSYHNSCSNCKWFDNTSACSLYTGPKPNRKRKAKEQLPPPPPAGITDDGGADGNSPATSLMEGRQENVFPRAQPNPQQEQPDLQPPTDPQLIEPQSELRTQPEPDMTPIQNDQREPESTAEHAPDPTDNDPPDPSAHSPPHTEISGSELAEAPSQTDSLTESHFLLSKHDREEESPQEADDDE